MKSTKQTNKSGPAKQAKPKSGKSRRPRADKTEAAPVATATKGKGRQPRISYKADGTSCLVSHKERIGTVLGSVAFATTQYSINPGLVGTFPWLSAIANRFEAYRFRRLVFHYKTKTATTSTGDVILVTDYDAADSGPETSIQAESFQAYADCAPWQNQSMGASHQNLEKFPQRYTRDTAIPTATDIKTYDVGNFYICTENQASAALVGYLYVEYEVELFTPQLRSSDFYISGGLATGGGTMSAANPLGTTASFNDSSRGVSVSAASRITISNPGTYVVSGFINGTVASAITMAAVSGCTVTTQIGSIANAAATAVSRSYSVVVTAFGGTLDVTATATTVTGSGFYVSSVPVGVVSLDTEPWASDVAIIGEWRPEEIRSLRDRIVETKDPSERARLLEVLRTTVPKK